MKKDISKYTIIILTMGYCCFLASYFFLPKSKFGTIPSIYIPVTKSLRFYPLLAVFQGVNYPKGVGTIRLKVYQLEREGAAIGETLIEELNSSDYRAPLQHFLNLDNVHFLSLIQRPLMHVYKYTSDAQAYVDTKSFKGLVGHDYQKLDDFFFNQKVSANYFLVSQRYCKNLPPESIIRINFEADILEFLNDNITKETISGNYHDFRC